MKRKLVLASLVAATAFAPTPAHADEICVTSNGDPVVCTPEIVELEPEQICVTVDGRPVACVF